MKNAHKHVKTALLTGLIFTTTALTSHAITMREAVAIAVTNHPDVKMAEQNTSALGHQVRRAQAGYLPTVDLTVGTGWEKSFNSTTDNRAATAFTDGGRDLWRNESRLTVRQMIFDGWATKSDVNEQKNREVSAHFNTIETQQIIALRALEAYLDMLRTRELVALGEENYQSHLKYMDQIKARVEGGRGSKADLRQAEGRLALANANKISFEGNLKNAEANFQEIIGEAAVNLNKSQAPFQALSPKILDVLARALANNPAIHSAQADVKAATASLAEVQSACCPRIDLEGNAGWNHNLDGVDTPNNEYSVMLMLRQNLYRGGADKARKHEQEARLEEAKESLNQTKRLVEENTLQAWAALQTAQNRLTPLTEHVMAATKTSEAYSAQFDLGQRTLLDLLDSEVELFNSRSSLINGKYSVDLAVYEVLAHTGDLVSTMTEELIADAK